MPRFQAHQATNRCFMKRETSGYQTRKTVFINRWGFLLRLCPLIYQVRETPPPAMSALGTQTNTYNRAVVTFAALGSTVRPETITCAANQWETK